ncbi:MAG: hypothetical protein CMM15_10780 [Rhodospirillaceae bacterium]|nr:hypothetical protein [Rhodospirillaceae bacterium]OUX67838.1 MAG: hypothetical protein CBD38_01035 [bacterium TMED178]
MIRSIPYRRNKNIKLGEPTLEPSMPDETGIPGSDPMPRDVLNKAGAEEILDDFSDLQKQEGGVEQDQLDEKTETFISNYVDAYYGKSTSSPADYQTSVTSITATMKYISIKLDVDASPADKVNTSNKVQRMQDNVVRKASKTKNTQTKNGFNIFKRSGFYSLRADPDVCDDDVNKARDQNKQDVNDDAENKLNDKQSKGKITKKVLTGLAKLLAWLATIGSVILLDWLVAKYKTDCYFIKGATENPINCKDYSKETSACQCPAILSTESESDVTVVNASEQGLGSYDLQTACPSATADIANGPVCAKFLGKTDYCSAPENIPSLDDPVCPQDGKSYFVWKQYSWMDILGNQLNELNDAANDLFNGLNWTFDNIGKVIIGVAVFLGAIILLKILQLLLKFNPGKHK